MLRHLRHLIEMLRGRRRGDELCADGCGRRVTCERIDGMLGEHPVVELVCARCKRARP